MKYSEINNKYIKYFITNLAENHFVAITEDLPDITYIKGFVYDVDNTFLKPIMIKKKDLVSDLLNHPKHFKLAKYRHTAVKGLRYE